MDNQKHIEEIAKNATNCNKHENMTCSDCKIRGMYGCAAYEVSSKLVNEKALNLLCATDLQTNEKIYFDDCGRIWQLLPPNNIYANEHLMPTGDTVFFRTVKIDSTFMSLQIHHIDIGEIQYEIVDANVTEKGRK